MTVAIVLRKRPIPAVPDWRLIQPFCDDSGADYVELAV
jgi:hypothetical protein